MKKIIMSTVISTAIFATTPVYSMEDRDPLKLTRLHAHALILNEISLKQQEINHFLPELYSRNELKWKQDELARLSALGCLLAEPPIDYPVGKAVILEDIQILQKKYNEGAAGIKIIKAGHLLSHCSVSFYEEKLNNIHENLNKKKIFYNLINNSLDSDLKGLAQNIYGKEKKKQEEKILEVKQRMERIENETLLSEYLKKYLEQKENKLIKLEGFMTLFSS